MARLTAVACAVLVACSALVASAAPVEVIGGNHVLQPNTPGQVIYITLGGQPDNIQGITFGVQIGDGGPSNGGVMTAPKITALDLIDVGNTDPVQFVFEGNNTGQFNFVPLPDLIAVASTTTAAGFVSTAGVLAKVVIDTTGTSPGQQFSLLMTGIGGGLFGEPFDSNMDSNHTVEQMYHGGSIQIVPEPSMLGLLGVLAVALAGLTIRRRFA